MSAAREDARPTNDITRAAAGTCQYLTRNDAGKLVECGSAAQWKGRQNGRLLYCDAHGRMVGRSMEVVALEADADGRRPTLKPWKEYLR